MTLAVLVAGGSAASAGAQEHASCPMHTPARDAQVDHAHHEATGLDNATSEHHFRLAKSGGSIELVATTDDAQTRDRIRQHLQAIARAFSGGDFSLPTRIHEQAPPGVAVMKERSRLIRYRFSELPRGGVVSIATDDAVSLAAVHEFLRFQIADHGTGDPTAPPE
jgi:hypothetical protein